MARFSGEYNGTPLVIVCVVLLIFTSISVSLRFYVRLFITRTPGYDDWLMLAAQIVFVLSCAFTLTSLHYGLGHHNADLPMGTRTKALEHQTISTITYVADMMFIKLSIAVFLLRIAFERRYVWVLKISMVVVTIWSITVFMLLLFECWPVAAQWDFTIEGKCYSGATFVRVAQSFSVMTIITDWLYALMPIPMIWSVRMSLLKKTMVLLILGLGVFASIATIIRLTYLLGDVSEDDILFTATGSEVWTLVEPGVAITAASLVTIRSLLRALNIPGFDNTDPYLPSRPRGARERNPPSVGQAPLSQPLESSVGSSSVARKFRGVGEVSMGTENTENREHDVEWSPEGITRTIDVEVTRITDRRHSWQLTTEDDGEHV